MATFFAHAVIPIMTVDLARPPEDLRRRLRIVAVACALLPDLDMVATVFEIRDTHPIGHRGFSHSLFMALAIAVVAGLLAFPKLPLFGPTFRRLVSFLFLTTAAHGLLDALTSGQIGVALLAPFTDARFVSPWKLLPSAPLGFDELLGTWGLLTIANELFYIFIPLALLRTFREARQNEESLARPIRTGAIWLVGAFALRMFVPDYFAPTLPRPIRAFGSAEAGDPNELPREGLPEGKLVMRLDELRAMGLFERVLVPNNEPWSSSFFPQWFGGEAGRWTDSTVVLSCRTIFGTTPPTSDEARGWLDAAARGDGAAQDRLFTLAPAEKIDLAYGHLDFPATTQALLHSHNHKPMPRYWNGRCNGIANASMRHPEPFRTVDVIGVNGARIRFHPNDVKALLAVGYDIADKETIVGRVCMQLGFDAGAQCSINPAILVAGLLNRIGIAKDTFMVDALPTIARQYYAVAATRIHVVREPYPPPANVDIEPELAPKVASLVDVDLDLSLSSTVLRYAVANRLDPKATDGTRYRRVGVVPVVMHYHATLALDSKSELVGGRWTGDPADGPDNIYLLGVPKLLPNGHLEAQDQIPWTFVQQLAQASADETTAAPTIDLRAQ